MYRLYYLLDKPRDFTPNEIDFVDKKSRCIAFWINKVNNLLHCLCRYFFLSEINITFGF